MRRFNPTRLDRLFRSFKSTFLEAFMMRALRDKRIMHVILWTLVAAFVGSIFFVFGMKYTSSNGKYDSNVYAAKVGDDGITRVDFNKACQPALEKLYSAREEGPTAEETKQIQGQVLDG